MCREQIEMTGRIRIDEEHVEQCFVAKGTVYRVCCPRSAKYPSTDDGEPYRWMVSVRQQHKEVEGEPWIYAHLWDGRIQYLQWRVSGGA